MAINLRAVLYDIAQRYPADMIEGQVYDSPRIAYNIDLALQATGKDIRDIEICDLGGGVGLFSVGCAAYGVKRSVLVDDFNDPINHQLGTSILDVHKSFGVNVVSHDIIRDGIRDLEGQFDVITTFDSMEHWHHSPKTLFSEVLAKLKPGGVFVLGVPNCKNLRKRVAIPLGMGKWSSMSDWYEQPQFRGHVREPDVDDLRYIACSMKLRDVKIRGRNWLGYWTRNLHLRKVMPLIDHALRPWPSLCADIYLVGRK